MGFLDSLFGSSEEEEAKPVDSLEQQRLGAIAEKKDAIYQAWKKTIIEKTTETYKLNKTSNAIYAPRELGRISGPAIDQRELESVMKKAAHDAFDALGLKVGEKVKFRVSTGTPEADNIIIYLTF